MEGTSLRCSIEECRYKMGGFLGAEMSTNAEPFLLMLAGDESTFRLNPPARR
jgi:hypothetical protein